MKKIALFSLTALVASSCAIVRPGEVGVKQKLGKLSNTIYTPGVVGFNPFIGRVIIASVRTNNMELSMSLPSKEGLSITSQISILYQLDAEKVPKVIQQLGLGYEPLIANIFRSAASDGQSRPGAASRSGCPAARNAANRRAESSCVARPIARTRGTAALKATARPGGRRPAGM